MTILAAAIGDDGVWIGCDGLSTCDGAVISRAERKWLFGPGKRWAIGVAGETAYNCALVELMTPDDWPRDEGEAGARLLVKAMRERLAGALEPGESEDGSPFADWGFSPLLASPAGAWRVACDLWCVYGPAERRYLTAGSGEDFALGAMHAGLLVKAPAQTLVKLGVEAACALSPACGGERWYHRMGGVVQGNGRA